MKPVTDLDTLFCARVVKVYINRFGLFNRSGRRVIFYGIYFLLLGFLRTLRTGAEKQQSNGKQYADNSF